MKGMMKIFFVVSVLIMTSAGCFNHNFSSGKAISEEEFARIQVDVSTMDQVREMLGKPQAKLITRTDEGVVEVWTYSFSSVRGSAFSPVIKSESRIVAFDVHGVVVRTLITEYQPIHKEPDPRPDPQLAGEGI